MESNLIIQNNAPEGSLTLFQEYDPATLSLDENTNLVIQQMLEFGTWIKKCWKQGVNI